MLSATGGSYRMIPRGLSSAFAARLRAEHGPNEVAQEAEVPLWRLLFEQFRSPVILLLIGAAIVSGVLQEVVDAIAILSIVIINGLVGFFQERRAGKAIAALRSMTAPRARVERDGRAELIAASEVVPGDLLLLEAGDVVAADATLVEASALLTNEAALTGESQPVAKSTSQAKADAALAERTASVFMGTAVASGAGRAVVVATGMKTELGKVAHLLSTAVDEDTPLQKRLAAVSKVLLWGCLGVVVLVVLLGLLRGRPWLEVVLSGVSLAVAAVPEGLPAIVIIALAIGVQRMAARNVLVRRLPAVETLGCATLICTDKTGTLTTGAMEVRELWGADEHRLLDTGAACCDAELSPDGTGGVGDPTELAILRAAAERGIQRPDIERDRPREKLEPFDSERKRMAIVRSDGLRYVKGAVEVMLPRCARGTEGAEAQNKLMAERGLRVLAVAIGRGAEDVDLELLGLIGIADPPRPEAITAIAAAREAGITTIMITGDHRATAEAIAKEMGLVKAGEVVAERVHARATPADKLEIVRAWKAKGGVVAMTGDGVNDAPALREAHIGIAMGQGGTEVAREASDMILADDNFASIVAAIREGRGIFENIRKSLVYLLVGNAAELAVMLGAAAFGLPLPLLPLHLLWINLVTDGLPALALVMEPVEQDAMRHPPRDPKEPLLGAPEWRFIAAVGAIETAVTLGVFAWALGARDETEARTLAFSVLVFTELFRSFAARSPGRLFWEVGAFTNLRLVLVVALSALLQIGLHQVEITRRLFELSVLPWQDGLLALGLGLISVSLIELAKLIRRRASRSSLPGTP